MNAIRKTRSLEYHPCRYGSSKILFRGPPRRLRGDYVAYLGGTETFGQFTETPYPALVEQATGLAAVNLGCVQAGVDAFSNSPTLLDICAMARVTVVQVMGAANLSNRFFSVDPRHNNRFLRASKRFKELIPEIDCTEIADTTQLLTMLARTAPDRLHLMRQEMQSAWVARMRCLLDQIDGPKLLLWLSDHRPFSKAEGGTVCREPLFVDRAMLNAVQGHADGLVEVVAFPSEILTGRKMLVHDETETASAAEMLGAIAHERAAQALAPAVTGLSGLAGLDIGQDQPQTALMAG